MGDIKNFHDEFYSKKRFINLYNELELKVYTDDEFELKYKCLTDLLKIIRMLWTMLSVFILIDRRFVVLLLQKISARVPLVVSAPKAKIHQ